MNRNELIIGALFMLTGLGYFIDFGFIISSAISLFLTVLLLFEIVKKFRQNVVDPLLISGLLVSPLTISILVAILTFIGIALIPIFGIGLILLMFVVAFTLATALPLSIIRIILGLILVARNLENFSNIKLSRRMTQVALLASVLLIAVFLAPQIQHTFYIGEYPYCAHYKVIDASTQQPLSGVEVKITSDYYYHSGECSKYPHPLTIDIDYTDGKGEASLCPSPYDRYLLQTCGGTITFKKSGYQTVEKSCWWNENSQYCDAFTSVWMYPSQTTTTIPTTTTINGEPTPGGWTLFLIAIVCVGAIYMFIKTIKWRGWLE